MNNKGLVRQCWFGIIALLAIGFFFFDRVIDDIVFLYSHDQELAWNVSAFVTLFVTTAIITSIVFKHVDSELVVILTLIDTIGSGVILIVDIYFPQAVVPLFVKLAWGGHVIGWFAGCATKAISSCRRSYYTRWMEITFDHPNRLDLYEHPRPELLDDGFNFIPPQIVHGFQLEPGRYRVISRGYGKAKDMSQVPGHLGFLGLCHQEW